MRERGSGRTEGLCWAALVTGLATCAYAAYAMVNGWVVMAAQQIQGGMAAGLR
jgi:hypothetical protein